MTTLSRHALLFVLCTSVGVVGCSPATLYMQQPVEDPSRPVYTVEPRLSDAEHILMFDERGRHVHQTGEVTEEVYRNHLGRMMDSLRASGKRKIFIYVHGGLNPGDKAQARAIKRIRAIEANGYFPVFINWESSWGSSYKDYLVSVRQGRRQSERYAEFMTEEELKDSITIPNLELLDDVGDIGGAPFYLGKDVARGFIRAPLTSANLANEALFKYRSRFGESGEGCRREAPLEGLQWRMGCDRRTTWDFLSSSFLRTVTVGTKLLSAFLIDAFGQGAWDNMLRRTRLLFHSHPFYASSYSPAPDCALTPNSPLHALDGGLSKFFCRLRTELMQDGENWKDKWEIIFVGHSMGTIIMNETLRRFSDLPFKHLVFMAAACSIWDFESAVFPYLSRNNGAHAYQLMLHELAELEEVNYGDIPIRGSLLVWIDEFLATPLTPLDRTAGRIDNWRPAWHHISNELRERISFKEFDFGGPDVDRHPQRHGDFSEFPFWEEEFWFGDPNRVGPARWKEPE